MSKTKDDFLVQLSALSDEGLIERFNKEVGNPGWTSSRASFLSALHKEFDRRNFDYRAIGNHERFSLRHKIALEKVVIPIAT